MDKYRQYNGGYPPLAPLLHTGYRASHSGRFRPFFRAHSHFTFFPKHRLKTDFLETAT